ncbi:Penicillin-binding protein 4 precursor [Methyloligella halotolerans]|uniref:Penicillin-binding protein 4 n=1 Tax=Methyloligella halotolerans TaxID=1177755 RepID=A0A1E2S386_9HYPH|nr:transglycosylase domain-containing protein [Methyloligella halotolerans]ODA68901.1 Penicillin-binding protein 4 precursor [Methyloligella halotolerans]
MARILKISLVIVAVVILAGVGYGAKGYLDALGDSDDLRARADALIAEGRSGRDLGAERLRSLLQVEDPAFYEHAGVDFSSDGAGATTISQSLSKRLAFEQFRPGLGKLRQTGYALGLEQRLTKQQILALWLDTLEMGRGPEGWMTGFYAASQAVYGKPPAKLSEDAFLRLVAVLIAPSSFDLLREDPELDVRVERIKRLVAGQCAPTGHGDVWLDGCRRTPG